MPVQSNANSLLAIQVWDKMVGSTVNEEIDIWDDIEIGKESFSGLQVNIVDDTDYGARAAEMSEGGAFSDADRVTRQQRVVTTQEIGIAGGLTFKAINAARQGAPGDRDWETKLA